jgi:prepilin-type N-terminal cleavage/methylation domain-containing protein
MLEAARRARVPLDRVSFAGALALMRRYGFTLLELLITFGIVGVSATLIGAGTSHAKAIAMKAKCGSNLRQLGVGMQIYLSDNHHYPNGSVESFLTAGLGTRSEWPVAILACPSIRGYSYWINVSGSKSTSDTVSLGLRSETPDGFVAEGQVVSPAQMIAIHDYVILNMPPKRGGYDQTGPRPDYTHAGIASYLFCDGGIRAYPVR